MQNECPNCHAQMIGDTHFVMCQSCGIIQPTAGFGGLIAADLDAEDPPVAPPRIERRRPTYHPPSFMPRRAAGR